MKHLVLYGDSLAERIGKTLILRLQDVLDNEYLIHNFGAGGFNTTDCLARASFIIKLPIDIIFISLGTNDAKPWKPVELSVYKENIQKLIEIFEADKIVWLLPPPLDEPKLQAAHKGLSNQIVAQYRDTAKQILTDNSVRFIDTEKVFQQLIERGIDYHVEDGVHLNETGYDAIFSELKTLING